MVDLPARTPPRTVSPNSTERRRRCAAGSTLRLRARCDPYGGGLPELPGRHGCACATGSRGSLRDADCSAEKSACSRVTPRTLGKNHDDVVPVTGGARSMGKSLVLNSERAAPAARHAEAPSMACRCYNAEGTRSNSAPCSRNDLTLLGGCPQPSALGFGPFVLGKVTVAHIYPQPVENYVD